MASIVERDEITVHGCSIRTTNALEMTGNGKIGDLWQQFYAHIAPKLSANACVYGVYYDYASDADGEFSVLVGSDENHGARETVTLSSGRYRQFSANGDMPEAVIQLWQVIWQYYQHNTHEKRAFTCDYECYNADNHVDIYIAVGN